MHEVYILITSCKKLKYTNLLPYLSKGGWPLVLSRKLLVLLDAKTLVSRLSSFVHYHVLTFLRIVMMSCLWWTIRFPRKTCKMHRSNNKSVAPSPRLGTTQIQRVTLTHAPSPGQSDPRKWSLMMSHHDSQMLYSYIEVIFGRASRFDAIAACQLASPKGPNDYFSRTMAPPHMSQQPTGARQYPVSALSETSPLRVGVVNTNYGYTHLGHTDHGRCEPRV